MAYELISFADEAALAEAAAARWLDAMEEAGDRPFCVALSGGRSARRFFSATAGQARQRETNWSRVHFFWADERCVPADQPESNYKAARHDLLLPLGIPDSLVHRIPGELPTAQAAACATADLRRCVSGNNSGMPILDLVFLGMGEDGHVASLFPGGPVAVSDDSATYVAIAAAPKPPPQRVTLAYAPILAASDVWVLVTGAGKEPAFAESLKPNGRTPLAHVLRGRSRTLVFSTADAAR
jgi:6-phosphogluconolactonase